MTFDSSPTEKSDNLVKSGVIYTALAGKADATATQTALAGKADATATQTALAGKQNALTAGANITIETVNDALTISATDTTYSAATISADGLMSTADKTKLAGIAAGAQVNVKPDWNAAAGTDAEILNKPTIPNYSNATASAAGLMSAADKAKLDGQGIVLWESASGYDTSGESFNLAASAVGYSFAEIYYKQGAAEACCRMKVNPTTGVSVTGQLFGWAFSSAAAEVKFKEGTATINASTLTISTNTNNSFKLYRILGYK